MKGENKMKKEDTEGWHPGEHQEEEGVYRHGDAEHGATFENIPTEAQLVLLSLDYLRDLRRSYPNGDDLAKYEGIHADYLSVAIYALSRCLLEPPSLQFHSRDGNDARFDRAAANDLTPGIFPREDPKSPQNWISIPNLTTINQEILYPSDPYSHESERSADNPEPLSWYQYEDYHPSNAHRFYPLQGLASGPALPGALTLGELVAAGLVGLGARSRHEAQEEMVQSPLFEQFVQAVESKGFFKDNSLQNHGEAMPVVGSVYRERYEKVVDKFRTKLAAKAEQDGDFGDDRAIEAAARQRLWRRRRMENGHYMYPPRPQQKSARGAPTRERATPDLPFAASTDDFTVGMSVVTSLTKKLAPSSPSMRQKHSGAALPHHQHPADGEEAEHLKGSGNAFMQKKQYDQAIGAYTAALKISPAGPNSYVYFSNRAAAHLSKKELDEAILDSERSLALRPDYAKAHARLGLAYFLKGNYRQAMEAYAVSLKYDPENKSSQAYLEKAAKRLAAQEIAEGVEHVPSRFGSGFSVASEWDKSETRSFDDPEDRKKLVDEQEAEKYKVKGNSFMASRNYRAALDAYSMAIKFSPNGPHSHVYYSNRAASLCYLEHYEEAEADSLRSLGLEPTYGKAHARLGLSRFFMGDYEGAVEAYTAALTFDPDNAASKSYLAKAKARLKQENTDEDEPDRAIREAHSRVRPR